MNNLLLRMLTQWGAARAGPSDTPRRGMPGFDIPGWFGIVASGGAPRRIVDRLAGAFEAAAKNPQVMEGVPKLGAKPRCIGARWFDAFMKAERHKWEPVVKASGASVH